MPTFLPSVETATEIRTLCNQVFDLMIEEDKLVHLLLFSQEQMEVLKNYYSWVKQVTIDSPDYSNRPQVDAEALLGRIQLLDDFGNDQEELRSSVLQYSLQNATIRLSTLLEVLVERIAILLLQREMEVFATSACPAIRCDLREFLATEESMRPEFVYRKLREQVGSSLKSDISKFDGLLQLFGLGGSYSDGMRKATIEMLNARNIIVHQFGKVDARASSAVPWLQWSPGDPLKLSLNQHGRFLAASLTIPMLIVRRLGDALPSLNWNRKRIVEELEGFLVAEPNPASPPSFSVWHMKRHAVRDPGANPTDAQSTN